MNTVQDEHLPILSLGMEHKVILTSRQRAILLNDRQQIIEQSIIAIQNNFIRLGKALGEIKRFKLYKADRLYPTWREYVKHRVIPKLHQSTITDYIGIVKMQLENKQFIQEEDLVKLGYKKVKLLKGKFNLIKKVKDPNEKKELFEKFKTYYLKSFKEFRDLPYSTYEKIFDFIPTQKKENNYITIQENSSFILKLDKKRHVITIMPKQNNQKSNHHLEEFFYTISNESD